PRPQRQSAYGLLPLRPRAAACCPSFLHVPWYNFLSALYIKRIERNCLRYYWHRGFLAALTTDDMTGNHPNKRGTANEHARISQKPPPFSHGGVGQAPWRVGGVEPGRHTAGGGITRSGRPG